MSLNSSDVSDEKKYYFLYSTKWEMISCNWFQCFTILTCFSLFLMGTSSPVYSQTLDEAIQTMLGSNCAGLGGAGTTGIGSLTPLCAVPTTNAGAATGGGGGTVQSTGLSISNSSVRQRLDEARSGMEGNQGLNGQASQQGMNASFESDRIWNRLSFFGSGDIEFLERDVTRFENGYDSTILGVTGGADYRFNEKTLGGVAFNYQNQNGNFKGTGGDFSTNKYGVTLFANMTLPSNTFVQILGGFTRGDNDVIRPVSFILQETGGGPIRANLSGNVASDSDSDTFNFGVLVGRDYLISKLTLGPRIGINYANTHIESYRESGSTGLELIYDDQRINSLQSTIGMVVSMPVSTGVGVFVPQFSADYIHELGNSQRIINVRFVQDARTNPTKFQFQNESPARNFVNLGFGVSAVLPHGIQPFANFRAMVGNEQFENYAGTFGIRVELGAT